MEKRCKWKCPDCKKKCGGVLEHPKPHQCPKHYNKYNQKITLPWMSRIRERIKEYEDLVEAGDIEKIDMQAYIDFISPVFEWGEKEEKRITEEFEK